MSSFIEIRKLAAVDMAWLGSRVIVAEYFAGIVLPLGLGAFTLRSIHPFHWSKLFGVWLITIAANYIPLFIYAVTIRRSETVATEGQPEIKHARRYGFQQLMILVPFLVVIVALIQELRRNQHPA